MSLRDDSNEIDMSGCPYYRGEGHCQSGCATEPSCMTDRPLDGWPSERKTKAQEPLSMTTKEQTE